MKYFSTFSGVGGFELAMPEHFECVGLSEIDKYASQVLKYHYPNVINYGDITKINWSAVPDFDLLVGGSPCQSFSIAGKRKGLDGESGLFSEYLRCLQKKKPEYFIWENVKGVLSSSSGADFAYILNAFSEAGYSLWWQVLNAKDFCVPQNRERVFVIGTRNGSPREILFELGSSTTCVEKKASGDIRERMESGEDALSRQSNEPSENINKYDTQQKPPCDPSWKLQPLRYLNRNQKNVEGDYSFTVDTSNTAGITDGTRVRRLTPCECERLMSWPDNWTKYGLNEKGETVEISDSQRYKMCGNGVVSKVVEEIIKQHLL